MELKKITLAVALALLLIACGGGDEPEPPANPEPAATEVAEQPTAEPTEAPTEAPTNTPEPEPTATDVPPTATPEPIVELPESVVLEDAGISLNYPTDFYTEQDESSIIVASNSDVVDEVPDSKGMFLLIQRTSFEDFSWLEFESEDAEGFVYALGNLIIEDTDLSMSAAQDISRFGLEGKTRLYFGRDEELDHNGSLEVYQDGEWFILVLADILGDDFDSEPVLNAILDSVELSEPIVAPDPIQSPIVAGDLPASGEYIYTNGNHTDDVIRFNDMAWTVGSGGVAGYDLASGEGKKYTTFDGLPGIGVHSVTVCPVAGEERLIVATGAGLALYDAAADTFEAAPWELPFVTEEIECDAANNRLVMDGDGLTFLDFESGELSSITEDDGLAYWSVERIGIFGDEIWAAGSWDGLTRIEADGTITAFTEDAANIPNPNIEDLDVAPDGSVWLAYTDGILHFNNGEFTDYNEENSEAVSFWGPDHIDVAADGTIYALFGTDLCTFDPATGACTSEETIDRVFDEFVGINEFIVYDDGTMVYSTYRAGAAYFDGENWNRLSLEGQAPGNVVDNMVQTSDGRIWVFGTGTVQFTDISGETWTDTEIWADDIAEAPDGSLWFIYFDELINWVDGFTKEYTDDDGLGDFSHEHLAVSDAGIVAAAGWSGVSIFDGENFTVISDDEGTWESASVHTIFFVDELLHIGSEDGLLTVDSDGTVNNVVPGQNITAHAILPDGTILLGTEEAGLLTFDGSSTTPFPGVDAVITDIDITPDGEIAVSAVKGWRSSSPEGGLFVYDGSEWSYRAATEFPNDSLETVLIDSAGAIWVGLDDFENGGGIFRIIR